MSAAQHPPGPALLRTPIMVLALVCVAGGLALVASGWLQAHQQRELNDLRERVAHARDELERMHVEADLLSAYETRFDALLANGLTGGEDRLVWMERLAAIERRHRAAQFRYEVSPRRRFEALPGFPLGPYVLSASSVEVFANFLHEGDLLGFLDGLRARYHGMVVPQRCALERLHEEGSRHDPLYPRIGLHCRFQWMSLKERAP